MWEWSYVSSLLGVLPLCPNEKEDGPSKSGSAQSKLDTQTGHKIFSVLKLTVRSRDGV